MNTRIDRPRTRKSRLAEGVPSLPGTAGLCVFCRCCSQFDHATRAVTSRFARMLNIEILHVVACSLRDSLFRVSNARGIGMSRMTTYLSHTITEENPKRNSSPETHNQPPLLSSHFSRTHNQPSSSPFFKAMDWSVILAYKTKRHKGSLCLPRSRLFMHGS